jgi:hypothetical protein
LVARVGCGAFSRNTKVIRFTDVNTTLNVHCRQVGAHTPSTHTCQLPTRRPRVKHRRTTERTQATTSGGATNRGGSRSAGQILPGRSESETHVRGCGARCHPCMITPTPARTVLVSHSACMRLLGVLCIHVYDRRRHVTSACGMGGDQGGQRGLTRWLAPIWVYHLAISWFVHQKTKRTRTPKYMER